MRTVAMIIQGRTFVVTGGSSGLGEATVRAIVERGGKVIVFDINEDRGEAIASELATSVFWPGTTDVAGEESVLNSIEKGMAKFGKISGVVNCGGIGMAQKIVFRNGEPQSLDIFEEVIRVNLIGTFNVCRLIAAHIIANIKADAEKDEDPGIIINVASIAYTEGQAGQTAYSASKGGVAGMTLPMARDLAGQVRVCTIAPGFFGTPMGEAVKDSNLQKHVVHPHRMGKPSEFAHLACAIIENPMMNGEIVRIDGAVRLGKL
ncbi:Dehydrogenase [Lunasporangiospora selenospora]|uniref:Dehydrogenase n=1 Tax=Lunasporangiospora selenospora TaxID=979761 RepID=A0A9P6KHP1_9FUNG|nr:Dehydrogenase [Lunasporangiospora selenospora]